MGKSLLFLLCLITFPVTFPSCNQGVERLSIITSLPPDLDGIIRDIPKERKSEHEQLLKNKAERSLGLQGLQNGADGLEIRIWEAEGPTYMGRLFLLRNDGRSWRGEYYYYRDSFSHAGSKGSPSSYEGATAIEMQMLAQTNGEWTRFTGKLFELQIDRLRDYSRIPGFFLGTDEGGILVEIAQGKFYKVYQIPTPSDRQEIKDARQATKILKLIDDKFGNKLKGSTDSG
jgi:hypothetical protein